MQNPPPYSPGSGSSLQVAVASLPGPSPDLPPTNYLHVREKNNAVKQKVFLDLSIPPPQTHALSTGTQGSDISNLILDSHNGAVSGEVWVLRSDAGDSASQRSKGTRDRVRLEFLSHNGSTKALVVSKNPPILGNNFLKVLAARSCVDGGASSVSPN